MTKTTVKNSQNFHSSGLRQKIEELMNILWAGGVNNPMDAIEQVSYLIFLRLLTERDEQHAKLNKGYERIFSGKFSKYAWGNFVTLSSDALFDAVRGALENLHELPGLSQTGKLLFSRATLKIYDRPTLRAVVQAIHNMDLETHDGTDLKGDMYEYLLSKLSVSGRNGQFRTPRHIIDMIVAMVDPKPGQRICDPACGTAGFLVSAYNRILNENKGTGKQNYPGGGLTPKHWQFLEEQAFSGYDNDSNMVKFAIMNLYLHRLPKANVEFHNPLTTPGPKSGGQYPGTVFDVILANPPFAGKVQGESILEDLNAGLNTRATELLFLKWFLDHLAPGGRAGIIVPDGVVGGEDGASRKLRQRLLEQFRILGVVSLPHACFKPYASVSTYVLIFEAGKTTQSAWLYRLGADGFSLDGSRKPVQENDIPDLLNQFSLRHQSSYMPMSGKHGWVNAQNIIDHGFYLVPRLYLDAKPSDNGYSTIRIGEICSLQKGSHSAANSTPGEYPLVTTAVDLRSSNSWEFDGEAVCIPLVSSTGHGHASMKRITYIKGRFAAASIVAVLQVRDPSKLVPEFLYYYLEAHKEELLVSRMKGAANISLSLEKISAVEIPLPPVSHQKQAVSKLLRNDKMMKSAQARIDACRENRNELLAEFAGMLTVKRSCLRKTRLAKS